MLSESEDQKVKDWRRALSARDLAKGPLCIAGPAAADAGTTTALVAVAPASSSAASSSAGPGPVPKKAKQTETKQVGKRADMMKFFAVPAKK